jgi:hypothetical protein
VGRRFRYNHWTIDYYSDGRDDGRICDKVHPSIKTTIIYAKVAMKKLSYASIALQDGYNKKVGGSNPPGRATSAASFASLLKAY